MKMFPPSSRTFYIRIGTIGGMTVNLKIERRKLTRGENLYSEGIHLSQAHSECYSMSHCGPEPADKKVKNTSMMYQPVSLRWNTLE